MDGVISLMLDRDVTLLHIFCDITDSVFFISINFNHEYHKTSLY